MRLDDGLGDGQTESHALAVMFARRVCPIKALEYTGDMRLGNTRTGILDLYRHYILD